jgi:hypothetical protein
VVGAGPVFASTNEHREMCGERGCRMEMMFTSDMPTAALNPFVPSIERLARERAEAAIAHGQLNVDLTIMIVTHREGLFALDQAAGETKRYAMPYVVCHEYVYDVQRRSFELIHDSPILKPVLRVPDVRDTRLFAWVEESVVPAVP